jgi:hypothetical protein
VRDEMGACERHADTGFGPRPHCLACNPAEPVEPESATPTQSEPSTEAPAQNGQHPPIDHPPATPRPVTNGRSPDAGTPPRQGGVQRSPFAASQP